jgi:hypothetical protein
MERNEYQYRETIRNLTGKNHALETQNKKLALSLSIEKQRVDELAKQVVHLKLELTRTRGMITWLPPDYAVMDI